MQFGRGKPSVGIFFDSDLGESIDSVLALAVLYGMQGKNESRVAAISIPKPDVDTLKFGDVLQRFFLAAPVGPDTGGGVGTLKNVPVGMPWDGKGEDPKPAVTATLAAFKSSVKDKRDSADPSTLFRNLLQAQYDQNAIFVLGGPATNLAAALDFRGMKDLILAKVRYLVVAGGAFPDGAAEAHIKGDVAAAKKVFAEWPTPIFAVGSEVGAALQFPGASIDKEFAAIPNHPVVAAYKGYRAMPYDAPALDAAAALYAGRPTAGYFKLSDPGTITVRDDGRTVFAPSAQGKHQYLIADAGQKDKILQAWVELASAKPVPPVRRFRPPVAADADKNAADKDKVVDPAKP
jgi:inosine-uridine nucleoside N-ribohydrolase